MLGVIPVQEASQDGQACTSSSGTCSRSRLGIVQTAIRDDHHVEHIGAGGDDSHFSLPPDETDALQIDDLSRRALQTRHRQPPSPAARQEPGSPAHPLQITLSRICRELRCLHDSAFQAPAGVVPAYRVTPCPTITLPQDLSGQEAPGPSVATSVRESSSGACFFFDVIGSTSKHGSRASSNP